MVSVKKLAPSEHDIQCAFFDWVRMMRNQVPALENCYAIPNGILKSAAAHVRLKREGFESGVWDVALDWPSFDKKFAGLRMECKRPKGKLSDNQTRWMRQYMEAGFNTKIFMSPEEGIRYIKEHLGLK